MPEFYLAYYLVKRLQRHGVIPSRTLTTVEVTFYDQKVFVLLHIVSLLHVLNTKLNNSPWQPILIFAA